MCVQTKANATSANTTCHLPHASRLLVTLPCSYNTYHTTNTQTLTHPHTWLDEKPSSASMPVGGMYTLSAALAR